MLPNLSVNRRIVWALFVCCLCSNGTLFAQANRPISTEPEAAPMPPVVAPPAAPVVPYISEPPAPVTPAAPIAPVVTPRDIDPLESLARDIVRKGTPAAPGRAAQTAGPVVDDVMSTLEPKAAEPITLDPVVDDVMAQALPVTDSESKSLGTASQAPAVIDEPTSPSSAGPAAATEASPLRINEPDPEAGMPLGPIQSPDGAAADSSEKPQGTFTWMLTTAAALAVVIGLILLLRAGISRMTGQPIATSKSSVLEVLARVAVAPKQHVLLVRMGGRVLVLGESTNGLTTLANIEHPDEVADVLQAVAASKQGSVSQGFAQMLNQFNDGYNDRQLAADEGVDQSEHQVDRTRDEVSGLLGRLRTMRTERVA